MIALSKTANLPALCDIRLFSFFKALVTVLFSLCVTSIKLLFTILKLYMRTV